MSSSILHITPHLGGGIGRVLLNYLKFTRNSEFLHKIYLLDYANNEALKIAKENNFDLCDNLFKDISKLLKAIQRADILLIHWWNHPLLYDFLVRYPLPSSRVIIWSHISGFTPPNVFTKKIINYADIFVLATPVSLKTKEVATLPVSKRGKIRVVWSTAGVDYVSKVKQHKHSGFNIGYIGTVDYSKLHPEFVEICSRIKIPEAHFIICGGNDHLRIESEIKKASLQNKFTFTGPINDISKYLSVFDVFGYPLAPYHYGTCDQVLAESMAAGVPPVVLSNMMESIMIEDKVTGLVANDIDDYVTAIKFLYTNKDYRKQLGRSAAEYAKNKFSISKLVDDWNTIFYEIMTYPKKERQWSINIPRKQISAFDIFTESLGDHANLFVNYKNSSNPQEKHSLMKKIKEIISIPPWNSETKGTPKHYLSFFKDDYYLNSLLI